MTTPIQETDMPDETPPLEGQAYNPVYPGSTADAPYGYKPDGEPYKRRPKGTAGGSSPTSPRRMPATESQARVAAELLARLNSLVAMSLYASGLPLTSEALNTANDGFREMAYQALLTDPALCRLILGAGATSGKAGLIMAYTMLGLAVAPAAKTEISVLTTQRKVKLDEQRNAAA